MDISSTYYDTLRERLKTAKIKVIEDLDTVRLSCMYIVYYVMLCIYVSVRMYTYRYNIYNYIYIYVCMYEY